MFGIVKRIVDAKAQFRSLAEPWADTGTSTGRLMLAVLGGHIRWVPLSNFLPARFRADATAALPNVLGVSIEDIRVKDSPDYATPG